MYYTIYKVTNKINGKFYIGSHKTKNLDDNYMGSGKYLKYAQEKHGIENFEKEILFVFDNPGDMYAKEKEIVNEDFLAEENTYNLKVGGFGGWDYLNSDKYDNLTHTIEHMTKMSNSVSIDNRRQSAKKGRDAIRKKYAGERPWVTLGFKGKSHTTETKELISKNAKDRLQDPKKNSQYGTRWIHSLELKCSKKIKRTDPIPDGWCLGRKLKFY